MSLVKQMNHSKPLADESERSPRWPLRRLARVAQPGVFLLLALLCGSRTVHAQVLVSATFTTVTGNDDKDDDTGVFVRAFSSDRARTLADITNGDNCSDNRCHYADGSQHTIAFSVQPGITKAICNGFVFILGARATGNDNWEIARATITLKFADGSTLERSVVAVRLNSRGSQLVQAWF